MRLRLATPVVFALAFLTSIAFAQSTPASVGGAAQGIVKIPLAKGVSMDDAVQAMKIRANTLNFKSVGDLPLSKQLQAMGQQSRRMEVFQFCDPVTAKHMVEHDMNFAAYLPCRISLVEDAHGKGWLVMLDLTPIIEQANLTPPLKQEALKVRDTLNQIMQAGAKGEW